MNCPLPAGTGSSEFRAVYEDIVFPALERFAPDLLLLSAGFDAHRDDPLAQMALDAGDFTWITQKLCALADKVSQGRVISILEGGYNLDALKQCVEAHILNLGVL